MLVQNIAEATRCVLMLQQTHLQCAYCIILPLLITEDPYPIFPTTTVSLSFPHMQCRQKTDQRMKKIQTFSYQPTPNIPHHTHTLVANCTDLGCNLSEHQGPSGLYVDRPGEQNQLRCTSPHPPPPPPATLTMGLAAGWSPLAWFVPHGAA